MGQAMGDTEVSAEMRLISRAVAGDAEALRDLLEREHPRLLDYVNTNLPEDLRRSIDPADIVQDTFFEACRLIGGFRHQGNDCLIRWLVTIARHRMLDALRRHRVVRVGGAPPLYEYDTDVADRLEALALHRRTPSKSAASHELMAALEAALGRLPEDYRQVVTLRHIDGLSVPDTAQRMQKSTEVIYRLCFRALQAIRLELESVSIFI
jgi:RNA polymerase sigma-70 factor (ECF subfamily)